MNDRFKFRIWYPKGNKLYPKDPLMEYFESSFGESFIPEGDDAIWMQNTGLKDLNGKDIYEGDIIKINRDSILCVVVWEQSKGRFHSDLILKNVTCSRSFYYFKTEIIGNKFEHAELLEGSK